MIVRNQDSKHSPPFRNSGPKYRCTTNVRTREHAVPHRTRETRTSVTQSTNLAKRVFHCTQAPFPARSFGGHVSFASDRNCLQVVRTMVRARHFSGNTVLAVMKKGMRGIPRPKKN